jgi:hypothetical protein
VAEREELIEELQSKGTKFSPDKVVQIGRRVHRGRQPDFLTCLLEERDA